MKIVTLITARPNCYDNITEVLTSDGWKFLKDIDYNTLLAQYNTDKTIEFVYPDNIICTKYNGNLINFSDNINRLDLSVTLNHRMVYLKNDKINIITADNLNLVQHNYIPRTGTKKTGTIDNLTPLEKLQIAFQADGSHVGQQYTNNINNRISFTFTKQRKIDRLLSIIDECKLKYKLYNSKNRPQNKIIVVYTPFKFKKTFEWVNLLELTEHWGKQFINELSYWDGVRRTNTRYNYSTSIKYNCDIIMAISTLSNISCNYRLDNPKKTNHSYSHALTILTNKPYIENRTLKKRYIKYNDYIHCVTVKSGMIVVRRNNKICISGNSSRLPNKHNRMIGNRTIMEWIIERVKPVSHEIVICTTHGNENFYAHYVEDTVHINAPNMDENNVVGRIKEAARKYKGDAYIVICGDCPLVSTEILSYMIASVRFNRGYVTVPGVHSHEGIEVITRKGLLKLKDGEHISVSMKELKPRVMPELNEGVQFRASVDNHADLAFMREAHKVLGDDRFNYNGVRDLVRSFPLIKLLNAHVNQKSTTFYTDKPNIGIITDGGHNEGLGHIARSIGLAQEYNECQHKHIEFFVNNNDKVIDMLEAAGYEKGLDFHIGPPVIVEEEYGKWEFITDRKSKQTINYGDIYLENPTFATNKRMLYTLTPIESDVLITFGMGQYTKYIEKALELVDNCHVLAVQNVSNIAEYILGADKVITMWSQTAREAILLGTPVEVYSANEEDDELCKKLHEKNYLTWLGNKSILDEVTITRKADNWYDSYYY